MIITISRLVTYTAQQVEATTWLASIPSLPNPISDPPKATKKEEVATTYKEEKTKQNSHPN
jgi:hypothetical protein